MLKKKMIQIYLLGVLFVCFPDGVYSCTLEILIICYTEKENTINYSPL